MIRLGIDLGGTKIEIAALDEGGQFRLRERIPTPRGDYAGTIRAVKGLVEQARTKLDAAAEIGIAIPGALSPATGLVKNANSTWLNGKHFDKDLSDALLSPVRLSNDANCFALSEAIDGAAAGASLVFGIIAGTGIGGGIVFNQNVRIGPHAIAGEWGHNPLPWPDARESPGPLCYCGKRGCIETWLSGPALTATYARLTQETLTPDVIASKAQAGEPSARLVMDQWLDRFARAIASLINILDPDIFVIGGGLSNLTAIYDELPARLGPYVFSDTVQSPIRKAKHGDSSGVRGAAWLWKSSS